MKCESCTRRNAPRAHAALLQQTHIGGVPRRKAFRPSIRVIISVAPCGGRDCVAC